MPFFFETSGAGAPETDFVRALDQLQALLPGVGTVALVVSWFGTDLRAGHCQVQPRVDTGTAAFKGGSKPYEWKVSGVTRAGATVVTQIAGKPAYGGTPADRAVKEAIEELNARGLKVLFYPFILMDVPPGNSLPDPYTGATGQPVFPWRGRITCDPAPGQPGTPDKTAAVTAQVDALFGTAAPGHFGAYAGNTVPYSGPAEFSLRRMILHYAKLCAAAGGVDAFLIGTEMRGLTTLRGASNSFPAVAKFQTLAADVKSLLPAAKVSYAADWSEYFGHQPADGSGDVFFHLDPLWADANIAFIAIDNYMPLADWREGEDHLDAAPGRGAHDRAYLAGNIAGGERFDWFYSSDADRRAQTRTTIADGAYGKPWVFRPKDLIAWWSNAHFNRPGGVESATPTAWVPQSKPIWFTELGCPAVDKGANQPNVFYDPKSSESALPHFSAGHRDDLIQRRFLEAHLAHWADPAKNPVSPVYDAPMVDADRIYLWTWDARPFPQFPARADLWGDADNWSYGHWLNGRAGLVPLDLLVAELCADAGIPDADVSALDGIIPGYVLDGTMSARGAIEPLAASFFFDAVESGGTIAFVRRDAPAAAALGFDDLVLPDGEDASPFSLTRAQESELPQVVRFAYQDAAADYRAASAEARRLSGRSERVAETSLPAVMEQAEMVGRAEAALMEAWSARERATFALPPSRLALDPGDAVSLDTGARVFDLRISAVGDAVARRVEAVQRDAAVYRVIPGAVRAYGGPGGASGTAVRRASEPAFALLDLPLLGTRSEESAHRPFAAAFASPWGTGAHVWRRDALSPLTRFFAAIDAPATLGELAFDFWSGPAGRWDHGNELWVDLYSDDTLESLDDYAVLGGGNAAFIENADGGWEVLQFASASLESPRRWKLTRLLRGQAGSEDAMRSPVAAGARVVIGTDALAELPLALDDVGREMTLLIGPARLAPSDPAYVEETRSFAGIGLRPLRPAQLRARWAASGDITLSWARRTRIGGDAWEGEVPLGETDERYRLRIYNGLSVAREVEVPSPAFVWTLAMQTADFGGQRWEADFEIAQWSDRFGFGPARRVTRYY